MSRLDKFIWLRHEERIPAIIVLLTSVAALVISFYCLESGLFTIFQNIYYFPIIFACIFFDRRGFVFSILLVFFYYLQVTSYTQDYFIIQGAMVRVFIFIGIAGVITHLAKNRSKMEYALKKSEERFRTVSDFTNDWEYWIDPEGKMIYVSPSCERIVGYTVQEFMDIPDLIEKITHPDDRDYVVQHTLDQMKSAQCFHDIEFRIITRQNEIRWIGHSCQPVHNPDGVFLGRRASNRDISARKALEANLHANNCELMHVSESLKIANNKLHLLTNITRHDLANQLTTILLMLDLAFDEENPDSTQSYIMESRDAAKRIERIMSFTRDYQDFGFCSVSWLPVRELINGVLLDLPSGIHGDNQIPADLEIFVDPLIKKVFYTLVDNSVRHGKTTTIIHFSVRKEDDALIIIVEDDGVGISPDMKNHIFEQGYGINTGLGLYLSREICAITGIEMYENGIKGARFELVIPKGSYRRNEKVNIRSVPSSSPGPSLYQ